MNIDNQSLLTYSLIFVIIVLIAILIFRNKNTSQKSSGNQSPNIWNGSGSVNVNITNNGISEAILLRIMDEKKIVIEERDKWKQKYKELEESISKRVDSLAKQAHEKLNTGDLKGAEKLLLQSFKQNLKIAKEHNKAAAADAFELGKIEELQLNYPEAKDYYEQAVQLDTQNAEYLDQFGYILNELGYHKEALKYLQQALDINKTLYGDKHPIIAEIYTNIGEVWENLGDPKKAIDNYYNKALAIDLAEYGENHPNVAKNYSNIGLAWTKIGNHKQALKELQKALDTFSPKEKREDLRVATIYNIMGLAWRNLNKFDKALEYYQKALNIDLLHGNTHPNVASRYLNIGMAWYNPGNPTRNLEESLKYFKKALKIYGNVYGNEHYKTKFVQDRINEISHE